MFVLALKWQPQAEFAHVHKNTKKNVMLLIIHCRMGCFVRNYLQK